MINMSGTVRKSCQKNYPNQVQQLQHGSISQGSKVYLGHSANTTCNKISSFPGLGSAPFSEGKHANLHARENYHNQAFL